MSSSSVDNHQHQLHATVLDQFLELLLDTPDLGTSRLYNHEENDESPSVRSQLLETCLFLFQRLQELTILHSQILSKNKKEKKNHNKKQGSGTSQLQQLFIDQDASMDSFHAETLWAQVDHLQSSSLLSSSTKSSASVGVDVSLMSLLKKSLKRLSKTAANKALIQLLAPIVDDEEASEEVENDDEDDDSTTKRIRARMDRSMKDDDSEEEEEGQQHKEDEQVEDPKNRTKKSKQRETSKNMKQEEEKEDDDSTAGMLDPAVQELNDGIFDIEEMEAFADEEEEYLPDAAFGVEKPEQDGVFQDKRSFHQRQRDGDVVNNDSDTDDDEREDDDGDNNGLSNRAQPFVRRRKYRDDEDIEALYQLYQEQHPDENDDDDVIHMTAATLFGKPNPKYFDKWKGHHTDKTKKNRGQDDDDSWNDYDFDKNDKSAGWGGGKDDDDEEEGQHDDSGSGDDEEEVVDDTVSMKKESSSSPSLKHMKSDSQRVSRKQVVVVAGGGNEDKLTLQTKLIEQEMLAEKPWQMRGEATSTSRPVNSLLEVDTPDFEVATKLAPVVTLEHTESIEEMIRRRILNEDWDDVIPRELPDVGWNLKRGELPEVSQEKSKLSLGELYEREYLKKAVGYDVEAAEKESELGKAKNEMKTLFANLCSKLDALSNYHFAPRPVAEEADVRVLTAKPAIAMEEVLPLHVSDARGSAPQEVYAGSNTKRGREGILRGESELEQPERKRLRATKKAARRKARKAKLADEKLITRLQPGLGLNNPYEKRKVRQELQEARAKGKLTTGQADANDVSYGDSGTFFKRLQQEAEQTIHGDSSRQADSGKNKKQTAPASKASTSLKL